MTNDGPTDNLRRILVDGLRIRAGERLVDEKIAAGSLPGPVTIIMVDLDSSATVRARGIEAKIALVRESRDRVRAQVPGGGLVIDSGTRDETYVVMSETGDDRGRTVAEALRKAVADRPFSIVGVDDPVRLTASVGYAVVDTPTSAADLFTRAREALHAAKQLRDCVRTVVSVPTEVTFTVPQPVLAGLERAGMELSEAVWVGLRALDEKHGGISHWAVERTVAATGELPPRSLVPNADADPGEHAFFSLLVWSAVFEAVLTARQAAGERFSLRTARVRDGRGVPDDLDAADLAVEYLPGEWVIARPVPPDEQLDKATAFDLAQAARDGVARDRAGTDGDPTVRLAVLPSQLALVEKIAARRGRTADRLFAEALQLAVDRAAAGRASVGSF
jgi:GGDEF domain-containing protein